MTKKAAKKAIKKAKEPPKRYRGQRGPDKEPRERKYNTGRPPKGLLEPIIKQPPKGPGGRPRREIDWPEVQRMAMYQCTPDEIADRLNIPVTTLQMQPEFRLIYKKAFGGGKVSMRRTLFREAVYGRNTAAMIFLGKSYLGLREHSELTINNNNAPPDFITERPDWLKYLSPEQLDQLQAISEHVERCLANEARVLQGDTIVDAEFVDEKEK